MQVSESQLRKILSEAADRFYASLAAAFPLAAPLLHRHLRRVPAAPNTVDVCLAITSFPAFWLPYWVTPTAERHSDEAFLCDLFRSTLNGYYFVRLIDNVADGDGPPELRGLLPLGGYFFDQFQSPYRPHFDAAHQFWLDFAAAWNEQAEAAAIEPYLGQIGAHEFRTVSARKFAAAKVPLAAALHRYGRSPEIPRWGAFVDKFGAFSQFFNDFFDWHHDAASGIPTFLQCEFERRRLGGNENVARWMAREGFEWGSNRLSSLIGELRSHAAELACDEAIDWLDRRESLLGQQMSEARSAIQGLANLEKILARN